MSGAVERDVARLRQPRPGDGGLGVRRRWDGATWFAINLVPATYGATIRVGDEFEVLEAVAPGGGPIRPAR